jgi:phenylacetic acid degradation operon negative regulatory protein
VPEGVLPPVTPLTARSVVLNALLGMRPPALPVSSLVRIGDLFGVAERTTRVALTRMVADGDLTAEAGVYRLTRRLARRRARLDEVRWPVITDWDGTWAMAVVTTTARPQAERVALRKVMLEARMGELREGVWMRPRNVGRSPADDASTADQCRFFTTGTDTPVDLAGTLWNLPAWHEEAHRLRAQLDDPELSLAERFVLASEVLRHLVVDPLLPPALQPAGWPADDLRARYVAFEATVAAEVRRHGEARA